MITNNACPTDDHYRPVTERGRARREKILAAAETVFFEMGFEAASVSEIVRRSGGSLATLYKMFGTKFELFESLVLTRAQALYDSLSVNRLSQLPPEQVLTEIGRNMADICASSKGSAMFRIIMAEGARFPALREIYVNKAINMVQKDLARYLASQAELGKLVVADSLMAARMFLEMAKGDFPARICCGETPPSRAAVERHVQAAVQLFLNGALPRPD